MENEISAHADVSTSDFLWWEILQYEHVHKTLDSDFDEDKQSVLSFYVNVNIYLTRLTHLISRFLKAWSRLHQRVFDITTAPTLEATRCVTMLCLCVVVDSSH